MESPGIVLLKPGVERWDIKTGTDAGAASVALTPAATTTIAALVAYDPPHWPPPARVPPVETTVWQLTATLTAFKLEQDGDYHLVLADDQGTTMIAEIPNPDPAFVVPSSPFAPGILAARQSFEARFVHQLDALDELEAVRAPGAPMPTLVNLSVPVYVIGVGFYDLPHGQLGVAPNAVEIHPTLSITFV